MAATARLTRNLLDRIAGGVCGGIGAHLAISAWWVRLAFIVLTVALPNLGFLLYALIWLNLPAQTLSDLSDTDKARRPVRAETTLLLGAGVIGVGAIALADTLGFLNGVKGDLLTPALLFLIGLTLLIRQLRRDRKSVV